MAKHNQHSTIFRLANVAPYWRSIALINQFCVNTVHERRKTNSNLAMQLPVRQNSMIAFKKQEGIKIVRLSEHDVHVGVPL